jgi:hypothetical protein
MGVGITGVGPEVMTMRRGLTVRMVVAGALLVVVVGTTFAVLLVAITQAAPATGL